MPGDGEDTYLELQHTLVDAAPRDEPAQVVQLALARLEVGGRGFVLRRRQQRQRTLDRVAGVDDGREAAAQLDAQR